MKLTALHAAAVAVLGCSSALAQNSDLGLLLGVSLKTSSVVSPGRVESKVGASGQINYAIQMRESTAGRLYLELPVLIADDSVSVVAGSVRSSNTTTVFFTPGVRFHHNLQPRVAVYGAVGGGIASAAGRSSYVGFGTVRSSTDRETSAAFGLGAGLDFRLTRLLSLRAEGRDFVTRAGLAGESGRNHAFFTIGIGFHF